MTLVISVLLHTDLSPAACAEGGKQQGNSLGKGGVGGLGGGGIGNEGAAGNVSNLRCSQAVYRLPGFQHLNCGRTAHILDLCRLNMLPTYPMPSWCKH